MLENPLVLSKDVDHSISENITYAAMNSTIAYGVNNLAERVAYKMDADFSKNIHKYGTAYTGSYLMLALGLANAFYHGNKEEGYIQIGSSIASAGVQYWLSK